MKNALIVEPWSSENESSALAFLKAHYATSMFLLGNREDRGTVLNDHPSSGNFKVIKESGDVVGVFCLAKRGNLLVTAEPNPKNLELILQSCLEENVQLKGVIGGWEISSALWEHFQEKKIITSCSFSSKEILYQLGSIPVYPPVPEVRFLKESDFDQWLPIRRAYNKEEGLTHELSDEQLRENFSLNATKRQHWGYFIENRLIATTALNSRALDIGQVGGVYTLPELRRQGYSQRTMRQMLNDCAQVHGLSRMILFTGEKNISAQRVYEELGFQRIGHFGIFFI